MKTEGQKMRRSWKPIGAGIASISGGVGQVIGGIVISVFHGKTLAFFGVDWWRTMGPLLVVSGIIAIVGGTYALERRLWILALVGSICALISPYSFIFGILAIIFVIMGKRGLK
jgi:hypothetical protein